MNMYPLDNIKIQHKTKSLQSTCGINKCFVLNTAWMIGSISHLTHLQEKLALTDITCCVLSTPPCPWGSGIDQSLFYHTTLLSSSLTQCPIML